MYSNTYREKYQEFLKIDFPRIPFTKDYRLFKALAGWGERLVELHLLKAEVLESPIVKLFGKGEKDVVTMWKFIEGGPGFKTRGNIFINPDKCFTPVNKEVWEYRIGGYQVLDKWLKDRKGRMLSAEDIKHYCRMVTALAKTIGIQKQIDRLYPKVEDTLSK